MLIPKDYNHPTVQERAEYCGERVTDHTQVRKALARHSQAIRKPFKGDSQAVLRFLRRALAEGEKEHAKGKYSNMDLNKSPASY